MFLHTEATMSVEPNDYMKRRTEQISLLQVGFEASQKLNDAMHRFLLDKFQQDQTIFRSHDELHLPVRGGSSDGFRYSYEDRRALDRYDRRLRSIGSVSIAIVQARTLVVEHGDIQVELLLSPSAEQRRRLGGHVLRHLEDTPDAPLAVYARLVHAELRQEDELRSAAVALRKACTGSPDVAESDAYYVTRPHILVRTGSQSGLSG